MAYFIVIKVLRTIYCIVIKVHRTTQSIVIEVNNYLRLMNTYIILKQNLNN